MEKLKLTLKRICDTRWSARSSAVKALCLHFAEVFEELKEYSSDLSNSDAMETAKRATSSNKFPVHLYSSDLE